MPLNAAARPAPDGRDQDECPQLAEGVQLVGELRHSGYLRPPCMVRRADGQSITLTPLLYLTVQQLDRGHAPEAAAREISSSYGKLVTGDDVRFLAEKKLRPLGLLKEPDGSEPRLRRANPLLSLSPRVMICNPRITRRVAQPFALFFHPWLVLPVVAAFSVLTWWLITEHGLSLAAYEAFYQPETLLLVWGAILLSAGFHELGHAAACRYGGATPGVMGAGLYLVWPAFYTDVTDSYRLGRGGRLRVDLGGLYFNAVFAVGMLAAWWASDVEALLLVVLAQHLQLVRQLAPFIRADGYHLLADLTGVPDLFAHIKPILLSMVPRRWGGRPHTVLKPWVRVVVTAWVLVVVPLLLGLLAMAVHVLPTLAATARDSVGLQREAAAAAWQEGDLAAATVRVVYMAVVTTPVLAILLLLFRLGRRTSTRVWRATKGRPRARAVAAATGLAILATVAWSWWPDGQYEPITPSSSASSQVPLPSQRTARTPARPPGISPPVAPILASVASPGRPRPAADAGVFRGARATQFYVVRDPSAPPNSWPSYGVIDEPGAPLWVFPFPAPPAPQEGDNRALSVNTTDDTMVTAMAVAWAVIQDEVADDRNEAHAYASCDRCVALAAAFQVLLLVGDPDVVAPVNVAAAATYECNQCHAVAIAVQLVVSITDIPSAEATALIQQAIDRLAALGPVLGSLSVEELYLAMTATSQQIMQILKDDGITPTQVPGSDATPSASSEATAPSAGATVSSEPPSPTDTTPQSTSEPSPTPTPTGTTSEEPSPVESQPETASPTPSP